MDQEHATRERVRQGYAAIAEQPISCCGGPSSCCSPDTTQNAGQLAQAIGYTPDELAALPEGANLGLSCGNPVALATLREGEVIVDLGSGGGFDVFVAGRKVGPTGRAIGVDMTHEMLGRARRNAETYRDITRLDNVEFRLGEIEHLPVADNCADVVISNCVINLSPYKPQVWREIARILKPGGRAAVSDIALLQPLPEAIRQKLEALVGCIAGAVLIEDTRRMMEAAGLTDIVFTPKPAYVEAMASSKDEFFQDIMRHLPPNARPGDYITSLDIAARKP